VQAEPVDVRYPEVLELVDALTVELAVAGYTPEETFGYTPEQLESEGVHLVGVRVEDRIVAIGGVQLQDGGSAELKRMYALPSARGSGAADAVMTSLLGHARERGVRVVRLETGDQQHAALRFYRRHGFVEVPRFPPYVDSATSICMQRPL
jgi:putative acetyltransferase